jgi:hypothetical protein
LLNPEIPKISVPVIYVDIRSEGSCRDLVVDSARDFWHGCLTSHERSSWPSTSEPHEVGSTRVAHHHPSAAHVDRAAGRNKKQPQAVVITAAGAPITTARR